MKHITAGVDIGSTMTKVVLMDDAVMTYVIGPTGAEHRRLANVVMKKALDQAKISFKEVAYVVATGYGRINVPFADKQITEITCHSRGVYSLFPSVRTIIEVGGQDAKAMKLANGKVIDFVMNDKCAAGTGRFLEVIADTLELSIDEMSELAMKSTSKVRVSSVCTVFAEQEIVTHLTRGAAIEDVASGIFEASANRIMGMAERLRIEKDIVLTGGGAKSKGLAKAFADRLGVQPLIPSEPLLTGAVGAALLGRELVQRAIEKGKPLESSERRLEEVTFFM